MVDTAPGTAPTNPPAQQVLAEQRAGNRDAALAALKQIRETAERPAPEQAAAPTPEAPPAATPPVEAQPETPAPEQTAAPVTPAADPPGVVQLRKQEQHLRRQIAEERAKLQQEIAAERAQWQAKLDAAAEREKKLANLRQDPIATLQALGLSEADFDPLGRLIYAASPAGKKDPSTAAAAAAELARAGQSREVLSTVEKLQQKIDALEGRIATQTQQQQQQAALDKYLGQVTKAVSDSTPLARAAMNKNPERTRALFAAIADDLYQQSGPSDDLRDAPTPSEVIAEYERRRAEELEELGIDPKTIGRAAVSPSQPSTPAARPAATIAPSGVAAPTAPKNPGPPSREEVLAGLQRLRTVP